MVTAATAVVTYDCFCLLLLMQFSFFVEMKRGERERERNKTPRAFETRRRKDLIVSKKKKLPL